jgi:hypothetical protein
MSERNEIDIDKVFEEGTPIDEALRSAVLHALWRHKRLGNPVAEWRDGKVVWVQPEDIPVPDDFGLRPGGLGEWV